MFNASELRRRVSDHRIATKDVEASFGETFRIKQLNLLERDEYQLLAFGDDGKLRKDLMKGNKARLIAMCLIDPDTNTTFADSDLIVLAFSIEQIDELFDACVEFNNLKPKAKEEAAGN